MTEQSYTVAGLMSGTSLDGLDIAICKFKKEEVWRFEILAAKTFEYDDKWKTRLASLHNSSALEISKAHIELGQLHGEWVKKFIDEKKLNVDFISSHGHTIFHQPEIQLTWQIGNAPSIASATQRPVIADFRTSDVALGGQGAPLVPIGDLLLFDEYRYCLNLGGIANISDKKSDSISAFDVCSCNMALNHVAQKLGHEYDSGGELARSGTLIPELFQQLNAPDFFKKQPPKSLGKEFFESQILPIIDVYADHKSVLHTLVCHIANQIAAVLHGSNNDSMLVTGGGAFNHFLIEKIKSQTNVSVVIPDEHIIQFKEALIFAFLGVLRMRNEINCLASVTGAKRDNVGGAIYLP